MQWREMGREAGIGVGLVLLLTIVAMMPVRSAFAQTETVTVDIPPQELSTALTALAGQTQLQLLYASELVHGLTTKGVVGTVTPQDAVRQLLEGTGLQHTFTDGKTVTLQSALPAGAEAGAAAIVAEGTHSKPVKVPEVLVKDVRQRDELPSEYPGGEVANGGKLGVLGNRDIMSTPFNQTNYTSKLIQNQQVRFIADVLNNDPTARASASTSTGADDLSIRGFNVSNADLLFNGLVGVAPSFFNSMMAESIERVEVFKGPNALLNGVAQQGSIGGAINLVPKRAGVDPLTQFTGSYISNSQLGGHVDIGRRYGSDKQFGIRFNGVYRNGDTAIDNQSRESALAALGLDYQGKRFRVSGDFGYQYQHMRGIRDFTSVASGLPLPSAPDAPINYDGKYDFTRPKVYYGTLRGEYDLTDYLTAFVAAGGNDRSTNYVLTNRTIIDAQGTLQATSRQMVAETMSAWTVETGLRGRFVTGPVHHQMVLAYTTFNRYRKEGLGASSSAPQSNIYNPVFGLAPDVSTDVPLGKIQDMTLSGTTIADTLSIFDERVQLTAGVRFQSIDNTRFNRTTGAVRSTYYESAVSPVVGLIVRPWQPFAFYANYIQGLQQGPTAPLTAANAGEIFSPFVTKQYEFGTKADFGRFGTTLAFYQITQPSGFVDPSTNIFGVIGEQRHRGVDFNVYGEVTKDVRLLGGAAYIDSELTKTNNGINEGHTGIGVPKWRLVLGSEWDTPFLQGFTLFVRGTRNGLMYLDAANTQEVPSWARLDLGARYTILQPTGKPITFRVNVTNVLNNNYWDASSFGQFTLSDPRIVWLSATINF